MAKYGSCVCSVKHAHTVMSDLSVNLCLNYFICIQEKSGNSLFKICGNLVGGISIISKFFMLTGLSLGALYRK